jgi:3-oxoadipate enol-lactonase
MIHTLPDGITLYYEIQGNSDADKTILFLNGLSQSTLAWSGIAPSFYKEYQVVLVDCVFQGQSGKAKEFRSYDAHAADIADLIRATKLRNVYVCGISYGSAITQHLLVNHSDLIKGGILVSTFAHNTALFNAMGESWKQALKAGGYPLMLEIMLPTVLGKSYFEKPLIPIETLKESRVARNLETDDLLKLMLATETRGDYREELKKIIAPVLIIQGEEDLLIPPSVAKEVADQISGSKLEIIENAGHTLNLEAIPQLTNLIREFINTH